jgi:hypothetical protein
MFGEKSGGATSDFVLEITRQASGERCRTGSYMISYDTRSELYRKYWSGFTPIPGFLFLGFTEYPNLSRIPHEGLPQTSY